MLNNLSKYPDIEHLLIVVLGEGINFYLDNIDSIREVYGNELVLKGEVTLVTENRSLIERLLEW